MKMGAVIVAAGRGTRMGGVDKCALMLNGRSLLSYSVETMRAATDAVVVVVGADRLASWQEYARAEDWQIVALVAGGMERSDSVRVGFDALRVAIPDVGLDAIHDGARPLVTTSQTRACLTAAGAYGAAILAAPVTDTIKRVQNGRVVETLDRATLWAAQTPQCFRTDLLAAAFVWMADTHNGPFTDEAGMVAAHGHPTHIVPTDARNLKVTRPGDLALAGALLSERMEAETE